MNTSVESWAPKPDTKSFSLSLNMDGGINSDRPSMSSTNTSSSPLTLHHATLLNCGEPTWSSLISIILTFACNILDGHSFARPISLEVHFCEPSYFWTTVKPSISVFSADRPAKKCRSICTGYSYGSPVAVPSLRQPDYFVREAKLRANC